MTTEHLIEQYGRPDTYVSGLAEVEDLGDGNFRFVFVARKRVGDREELVVVANLVAPLQAVPPALVKAAKAIGMMVVTEVPRRVH